MELRHLVTFRKVANYLSFTRAAVELNYAQSSVTNQIRSLEAALEAELFERLGGRIRLTEAGKRLLPYADQIINLAEEARIEVAGKSEPSGQLSIGTMESITSYRLPPLLELFHHRYPQMQLSLRPSLCAETCQALRQGVYDVGFIMEAETRHEGVETEVLAQERLVLVTAPDHPMAATVGGTVTVEQLRATTILAAEPGCAYRDLFEEYLNTKTGEPASFLEFGTIEAIKRGTIASLGVTLLPEISVAEAVAQGALVVLPWEPPFSVYTQLAWRSGKRLSRELRLFISETMRLVREDTVQERTA